MNTKLFSRSRLATLVHFLMLFWSLTCFIGTWFIIIKYKILFEGFVALATTFLFGAFVWVIPLGGLTILSLYVTPTDPPPSYVMFKELIKKGVRESVK